MFIKINHHHKFILSTRIWISNSELGLFLGTKHHGVPGGGGGPHFFLQHTFLLNLQDLDNFWIVLSYSLKLFSLSRFFLDEPGPSTLKKKTNNTSRLIWWCNLLFIYGPIAHNIVINRVCHMFVTCDTYIILLVGFHRNRGKNIPLMFY